MSWLERKLTLAMRPHARCQALPAASLYELVRLQAYSGNVTSGPLSGLASGSMPWTAPEIVRRRPLQLYDSSCKVHLQGVHAELIVMEPYPIRPHTFGRALRFIDSEQSLALFRDLRTAGLINAQGYGKLPPANGSDTW